MRRTCDGCRALTASTNGGYYCALGYKIHSTRFYFEIALDHIPSEKCPKPKTFKPLNELLTTPLNQSEI